MNLVVQILIAVLAFGLMIFVHELGHFTAAKLSKMRVNEFAIGMGPTLVSKQFGETRYALRALPVGGFVAVEGDDEGSNDPRAFGNVRLWKRIAFVCAGAFMNLVMGLVIFAIVLSSVQSLATTTIGRFRQENPHSNASLQVDDQILRVNGSRVFTWSDIQFSMQLDPDGMIDFTVLRDGQKIEVERVDFHMQESEDGSRNIDMDFASKGVENNFLVTLKYAWLNICSVVRQVLLSVVYLITGNFKVSDLSGPVGVVVAIGQAAQYGFDNLLFFVAMISVNIGVFNLLPLLALDGGRLLFLIIEGIRRKPVKPKYEAIIHTAGFVLLMGFMLFVTVHDIIRI